MHFLGRHEEFETFGRTKPVHDPKSRRIQRPRQPSGALPALAAGDAEATGVVVG